MREEDEAVTVMLAQRGDTAAFERLLRSLHAPLRAYVSAMVSSSNADDVLQEVALRIHRQIKHLREPKVFRAWTYRIATRLALIHLKREKQWRAVEAQAELLQNGTSFEPPDALEVDAEFLRLVDQVTPASRAVLLLHYQQHLSLEETAAILDIPLGTAKSRLSYAISVLRNILREKTNS